MTTAMTGWRSLRRPAAPATVDPQGAADARKQSLAALEKEKTRVVESRKVGASLRDLRSQNHFAEKIYNVMGKPDAPPA